MSEQKLTKQLMHQWATETLDMAKALTSNQTELLRAVIFVYDPDNSEKEWVVTDELDIERLVTRLQAALQREPDTVRT